MNRKQTLAALAAMALLCAGAGVRAAQTAVYDTSFAVESSQACLAGGCHEQNADLLAGYTASFMTHVMVKYFNGSPTSSPKYPTIVTI